MSQMLHQKLDDISQTICNLRDVGDSVFDELQAKVSKLLVQVEVQRSLNEIARTIRDGSALPVRRINYNIKKLSEDDEACQIRWSALRKLKCPEIIFSTMAFAGLISLHDKQFEYLVENVPNYIEVQELPCDWIARDQIRKVVASTPRRENTQPFLQDYHGLEIQLNQADASNSKKENAALKKRKRHEGDQTLSTSQGTAGLSSPTLSRQQSSGMIRLPRLQQMVEPCSLSHDQTQTQSYRQYVSSDNGYDGISGDQRQPLPRQSIHHSTLRYESEYTDDTLPPSKENREIKYMYTNAPASHISKIPEPFRTAIKESRLWKWERSHNMKTTGCWPSLFPKDNRQDVSFTIWCGHEDGYQLTDFFGSELASS